MRFNLDVILFMRMKKSISVDFDGTLTRVDVKEFIKELIQNNIVIYIVTGRYNDLLCHLNTSSNDDLFALATELEILHRNIIFTNRSDKSYVLGGSKLAFHLDDDIQTVNEINQYSDVPAICVQQPNWKEKCIELLNDIGQ